MKYLQIKKIVLFLFLIVTTSNLLGQEFPTIIPPSPNASAIHTYGNSQVNHYTGSTDVSIPIWEITEGDLTLPIYLKYTGSNGIRVDEQASLVGLGWSLNAGGAISRVKRGVADEAQYGFMSYSSLPETIYSGSQFVNINEFAEIFDGKRDSEPDKFSYNLPTCSGNFFINYDNQVHLKPFKDVDVQFALNTNGDTETVSSVNCNPNSPSISSFTVKDDQGITYTLSDKERNNSKIIGADFLNNLCYPSTWYLSKIENANKTHEIEFEYEPYLYTITRLNIVATANRSDHESESYVEDHYIGKRLKKITYSKGSIEFIKKSQSRKDIANEYALDAIIVKDKQGNQIKKFVFEYGYLTNNALVDYNASLSVSNSNRLVLKSVEEVSLANNTNGAYEFVYNTTHFLPSTYSKAKDHWGYYNGKTSNSKFQPKHIATWFDSFNSQWVTDVYGSANRNADAVFTQAGILKEIKYPTGGKTQFEYEGNIGVDDALPRELIGHNFVLDAIYNASNANTYEDFTISLYSQAAPVTKVSISAFNYISNGCTPDVYIKNLSTNQIQIISFASSGGGGPGGSGGPGSGSEDILLASGNYRAYYTMNSNTISCSNVDPAVISISWDNESASPNNKVGGVRIKKITDISNHGNNLVRNFEYLNDNGVSSGSVINTPVYGFQSFINYFESPNTFVPLSYITMTTTSYHPLVGDGGSPIGYSKVTVKQNNGENGKTDYYFTTPDDFDDARNGFFEHNDQSDVVLFEGVDVKSYPHVPESSMAYLRGKLLKKIDFKFENSTYTKIREEENEYKNLYFYHDTPGMEHPENKTRIIEGLVVDFKYQSLGNIKKYKIHSGYSIIEKKIVREYHGSNEINTTTGLFYKEDNDGVSTRFAPIKIKTKGSNQQNLISKNYYPDDVTTTSSLGGDVLNSIEKSAIDKLKKDQQHRVSSLIQSESYNDTNNNGVADANELLSRQRTNYKDWDSSNVNLILPESIESIKEQQTASNTSENRILFQKYDVLSGNPLEMSKPNGVKISYLWGYNNQYPVAKVENATHAQILATGVSITTINNASTSDAAMRAELDKIRTGLPNAMVTTYTYAQQIGVTSSTDPRGSTIYYEYDEFQRLKLVRDQNNKIVSKNEYHYKGQN